MAKKAKGGAPTYGAYLFKEKEPVIDMTRTLLEDVYGRRIDNKMLAEIQKQGGPTASCMRGWFFGDTMRPNNVTVEACGRSLGYERIWRKRK